MTPSHRKELERLLTCACNASFDCGEFTDSDKSGAEARAEYDVLLEELQTAKANLIAFVERLTDESALRTAAEQAVRRLEKLNESVDDELGEDPTVARLKAALTASPPSNRPAPKAREEMSA